MAPIAGWFFQFEHTDTSRILAWNLPVIDAPSYHYRYEMGELRAPFSYR